MHNTFHPADNAVKRLSTFLSRADMYCENVITAVELPDRVFIYVSRDTAGWFFAGKIQVTDIENGDAFMLTLCTDIYRTTNYVHALQNFTARINQALT